VVVVVDAENAVQEQNEGNNQRSEGFEVRLKPAMGQMFDLERNLAVYDFEVSDTEVASEDRIDVDFRLKNQGDGLVPQVSYEIFISSAPADSPEFRDSEVASLFTGTVSNLAPDANVLISRMVTIPTIRINRTTPYYLSVWVESAPGAADDDPQNNGRSVLVEIDPDALPNLAVTRFEIRQDEPLPAGELFDIDFTIENIGTRASPPCQYKVGLSWDAEWRPGIAGDQPDRYYDVYALDPGESMSGSLRFQVPEGAAHIWVSIVVDPDGVVPQPGGSTYDVVTLQGIEIEQTE
jgi:hypothetical protein